MENSFAARLRLVRGKESREKFAKKLGLSPRALLNYENGTRVPKSDLLSQICARLGIDIAWLLTGASSDGSIPEIKRGTSDMSEVFEGGDISQHIENIALKEKKSSDLAEVMLSYEESRNLYQKMLDLQERIATLLEDKAALQVALERANMDTERRDQRIRELERENAGLREAQKGAARLYCSHTGDAG